MTNNQLQLALTTALGPNVLVPHHLKGTEAISQLFDFQVVCSANDKALTLSSLLSKPATLTLTIGSYKRYFSGIVTEVIQGATLPASTPIEGHPQSQSITYYTLRLRPQLWLLTLIQDCRIFQQKTAMDIIKAILQEQNITPLQDKTTSRGQGQREYCVQYNETSFNFITRLMEEEGIFYFFDYSANNHTLILGDTAEVYPKCPSLSEISYEPDHIYGAGMMVIKQCQASEQIIPGQFTYNDFNFKQPDSSLLATAKGKSSLGNLYEYPGKYEQSSDGHALSDLKLASYEMMEMQLEGLSTSPFLTAGHTFTLKKHVADKLNQSYVLFKVQHEIHRDLTGEDLQTKCENSFHSVPSSLAFRPSNLTPKPKMHGSQTAIVTGQSGEEIFIDDFGRIKVHFAWDRKGTKDEKSSCWIRVSQQFAGKQWGGFFIPRIGQEVVVSYLDGDPDRPLVTGAVYNGTHQPPYGPADKTKSSIKTDSSKDGKGFNELRFDDLKDSEEIFVHAEKDINITVKNGSRTATLQAKKGQAVQDSLLIEQGNHLITLKKGSQTITLNEGDQTMTLKKGKRTVDVKGGDEVHKNDQNFAHNVTKNYTLKIQGDLTIQVTGKVNVKAKKAMSFETSDSLTIKATKDITLQAGKKMEFKAGSQMNGQSGAAMQWKAGANMQLEASANFQAKSGVNLTAQGGANATFQGGSNATLSGGTATMVKGSKVLIG